MDQGNSGSNNPEPTGLIYGSPNLVFGW